MGAEVKVEVEISESPETIYYSLPLLTSEQYLTSCFQKIQDKLMML